MNSHRQEIIPTLQKIWPKEQGGPLDKGEDSHLNLALGAGERINLIYFLSFFMACFGIDTRGIFSFELGPKAHPADFKINLKAITSQ